MSSQSATSPRRPARDLIDAVLENMRNNLEPLKYSTLAPNRFVVYLHPEEFSRVESMVPILQEQTARALEDELRKLNNPPAYRRYIGRMTGSSMPVENAGRDWQIEFHPDADDELAPGDILIHSELMLPAATGDDLGAGQRTRRITTVHVGQRTTKREETVSRTAPASNVVHARLQYEDNSGPHSFEMSRDSIVIGRGGIAYKADVRIDSSVDVSREHVRIRRDSRSGAFFIIDLSTLGTTVNGQPVPKGFDVADGTKRENGIESPLPTGSRIGLADTVFLRFDIAPRS
ncbi:MAG TPA: FHA domain-containing protein [Vicinamibacterales bacterium]|jgi:FHA domain-containing protein|nr:FHA domain-containing protein [Vicinamibacterales bacterium]